MAVESANTVLMEIFGTDSRVFVEAIYLKNGILGIRTSGSGATLEIRMREGDIIAQINQKFGGPTVNKIKFLS